MLVIVIGKAIVYAFIECFHVPNMWDFLDALFIIFKIKEELKGLL